ncbi:MAG: c-type cytochrome [Alphaproteobacteria bacterium]|jgi:cytochrome c553|nr:c-type cytochrome [Alphaproteobacteria bacterium]MDP6564669.1 c-type cytochrome [Alphaproteobacteria bacterium]MDP6816155.1 c-type cytochrome [Alphaproteobacteria bacterium]
MKNRSCIAAAFAASLVLGVPSLAAADSMDSNMLGNPCAGCHGTAGQSKGAMPTIKGKSAKFIAKALKDFRDGKKPSTVMQRIAKGYTDAQIDALAKQYGG